MNWKLNSLFVLLVGAFALGGYAFLEGDADAYNAGSYRGIAYPSVSGNRSFGNGAAVSDDVLVPMTGSDAAHRLFHAGGAALPTAASSPSRATSGAASGTTSGAGASGMYLTSGSTVRSYGGGSDQGGYAAGSTSRGANTSGSVSASTYSMTPTFAVNRSYTSGSNYASASALYTNGYTSADDALAVRSGMPRRAPEVEDEFCEWLKSGKWNYGGGSQTLSQADIEALWMALTGGDLNTHMPNGMTYEAFYQWFMSKQSEEGFQWKLPVGDALPILLLLSALWGLHIYRRQTKKEIL